MFTGRKVWMAGTDIPYVSLPSGEEFLGNIVDAISPVDMHVTPLVIKGRSNKSTIARDDETVCIFYLVPVIFVHPLHWYT